MIGGLVVREARFQALRQRQNGGMGFAFKPAPNARIRAKVKSWLFLAAIRPMRQLSKGYAELEGVVGEAGG
jgi:hypothetical protein